MENGLRFASYSLVYMVIVCHSKNKTENDYHVFIKLHVIKINYFSIQKHSKKFFFENLSTAQYSWVLLLF